MKAKDIMTASPYCCSSSDSLQDVARGMREHDCGAVPVVDGGKVIGIVTDRDITVRAVADGRAAGSAVGDIITRNPSCCGPDDDVSAVGKVMADHQVRRVPIVSADGKVVGIVAQADLARASGERVSEHDVATVVERISEPAGKP